MANLLLTVCCAVLLLQAPINGLPTSSNTVGDQDWAPLQGSDISAPDFSITDSLYLVYKNVDERNIVMAKALQLWRNALVPYLAFHVKLEFVSDSPVAFSSSVASQMSVIFRVVGKSRMTIDVEAAKTSFHQQVAAAHMGDVENGPDSGTSTAAGALLSFDFTDTISFTFSNEQQRDDLLQRILIIWKSSLSTYKAVNVRITFVTQQLDTKSGSGRGASKTYIVTYRLNGQSSKLVNEDEAKSAFKATLQKTTIKGVGFGSSATKSSDDDDSSSSDSVSSSSGPGSSFTITDTITLTFANEEERTALFNQMLMIWGPFLSPYQTSNVQVKLIKQQRVSGNTYTVTYTVFGQSIKTIEQDVVKKSFRQALQDSPVKGIEIMTSSTTTTNDDSDSDDSSSTSGGSPFTVTDSISMRFSNEQERQRLLDQILSVFMSTFTSYGGSNLQIKFLKQQPGKISGTFVVTFVITGKSSKTVKQDEVKKSFRQTLTLTPINGVDVKATTDADSDDDSTTTGQGTAIVSKIKATQATDDDDSDNDTDDSSVDGPNTRSDISSGNHHSSYVSVSGQYSKSESHSKKSSSTSMGSMSVSSHKFVDSIRIVYNTVDERDIALEDIRVLWVKILGAKASDVQIKMEDDATSPRSKIHTIRFSLMITGSVSDSDLEDFLLTFWEQLQTHKNLILKKAARLLVLPHITGSLDHMSEKQQSSKMTQFSIDDARVFTYNTDAELNAQLMKIKELWITVLGGSQNVDGVEIHVDNNVVSNDAHMISYTISGSSTININDHERSRLMALFLEALFNARFSFIILGQTGRSQVTTKRMVVQTPAPTEAPSDDNDDSEEDTTTAKPKPKPTKSNLLEILSSKSTTRAPVTTTPAPADDDSDNGSEDSSEADHSSRFMAHFTISHSLMITYTSESELSAALMKLKNLWITVLGGADKVSSVDIHVDRNILSSGAHMISYTISGSSVSQIDSVQMLMMFAKALINAHFSFIITSSAEVQTTSEAPDMSIQFTIEHSMSIMYQSESELKDILTKIKTLWMTILGDSQVNGIEILVKSNTVSNGVHMLTYTISGTSLVQIDTARMLTMFLKAMMSAQWSFVYTSQKVEMHSDDNSDEQLETTTKKRKTTTTTAPSDDSDDSDQDTTTVRATTRTTMKIKPTTTTVAPPSDDSDEEMTTPYTTIMTTTKVRGDSYEVIHGRKSTAAPKPSDDSDDSDDHSSEIKQKVMVDMTKEQQKDSVELRGSITIRYRNNKERDRQLESIRKLLSDSDRSLGLRQVKVRFYKEIQSEFAELGSDEDVHEISFILSGSTRKSFDSDDSSRALTLVLKGSGFSFLIRSSVSDSVDASGSSSRFDRLAVNGDSGNDMSADSNTGPSNVYLIHDQYRITADSDEERSAHVQRLREAWNMTLQKDAEFFQLSVYEDMALAGKNFKTHDIRYVVLVLSSNAALDLTRVRSSFMKVKPAAKVALVSPVPDAGPSVYDAIAVRDSIAWSYGDDGERVHSSFETGLKQLWQMALGDDAKIVEVYIYDDQLISTSLMASETKSKKLHQLIYVTLVVSKRTDLSSDALRSQLDQVLIKKSLAALENANFCKS